jgi:hypothetical protein
MDYRVGVCNAAATAVFVDLSARNVSWYFISYSESILRNSEYYGDCEKLAVG